MTESDKKLVIVCWTMPPLVVGSTVLMNNLFRCYRGKLEAVAGWTPGIKVDPEFVPPCKTCYLRYRPSILQRIMAYRLQRLSFFVTRWYVYLALLRRKPDVVFAVYPDTIFFIAAFQACRRLRIPFWGHMHDLWLENTRKGSYFRALAEHWEPIILHEADRIFCMTDVQREHLRGKYPRDYAILPHCIPENREAAADRVPRTTAVEEEKRILYTGNISQPLNLDAMREFVRTVDLLPANFKVTILTSWTVQQCKAAGVYSERIVYDWVSVAESRRLIREVDVLFLPLSFKSCVADEVRTVFATKTLDYLTAGVPILTYAPADSFHSRSARENGWGYVVDREDPALLAAKLQELANDAALRKRIVANAFEEAARRDPRHWAEYLAGEVRRGGEPRLGPIVSVHEEIL
jgi:glycosyltransferase involved in cell wall biosynthesis